MLLLCVFVQTWLTNSHTCTQTDGHGEQCSFSAVFMSVEEIAFQTCWERCDIQLIISSLWVWVRHKGYSHVSSHKISTMGFCRVSHFKCKNLQLWLWNIKQVKHGVQSVRMTLSLPQLVICLIRSIPRFMCTWIFLVCRESNLAFNYLLKDTVSIIFPGLRRLFI